MKNLFLLMFGVLIMSDIFSQGEMKTRNWRNSQVDSLGVAEAMFEEQNFITAASIFDKIQQEHPGEFYLRYKTGICGLFRSDMHEKAMNFLAEVYSKNPNAEDIEYYLAKAYHYNYKFDDALLMLNNYMKRKNLSVPQKRNAMQLADYCRNAKVLVASPVDAKIENMNDVINSVNSEYVPLISSDESLIIYTYRGDQSTGGLQNELNQPDPFGVYYEDVFIAHKENGTWTSPSGIGANINTNEHDAAIALSNDGQKLFIFRDNGIDGGDIYLSRLENSDWTIPQKLPGGINTPAWEGRASISSDEKTIYFSSERPGGFGGKDIYSASLQPDGSWGNIKNLGLAINTPFDDDAPFIHPDGKTLIYSSKGLNSMGGYDIFSSTFNSSDSSWSTPKNLGYPINTTDEDIYFVLSADGNRGYYASGKEGGYGLQDIYTVDMPDNYSKPVVAMITGTTLLDDKPVAVTIQVDDADTESNYGNFSSNGSDGSYLINLKPGHKYSLIYKLKNYPGQVQTIDLTNQKVYSQKNIEINFSVKNVIAQKD
jgi:hypothetical protein